MPDLDAAARRGRGRDPRGRFQRRARGAAGALPRPQVGAHRHAALDRRAAARPARAGGQGGERGARWRSRRCSRSAPRSCEATELDRRLAEDRIDVTLPGDPPQPAGRLHLVSQIRRQMEDIFVGLGFSVLEGPEVEYELLQLHRAQPPARASGARRRATPSTSPSRCCCAPTPRRCRCARWRSQEPPIYVVVPGRVYRPDTPDATHVPMFHQLEGLADRRGHHPGRPPGRAARLRPPDVRRGHEGAPASGLLPVHRAERGGGRVLLPLRRHRLRGLAALRHLQGRGLDRDPRLRDGRPERARLRGAAPATTTSECRASRSGWASSASRAGATRCRTCGCSTTTTCACWSSSGRA